MVLQSLQNRISIELIVSDNMFVLAVLTVLSVQGVFSEECSFTRDCSFKSECVDIQVEMQIHLIKIDLVPENINVISQHGSFSFMLTY